ncbi:hypothetical protein I6E29_09040 [Arcanobacterium haemolyticum]|nr:hypothetical protein [Arcanobacterium haemolyticum]
MVDVTISETITTATDLQLYDPQIECKDADGSNVPVTDFAVTSKTATAKLKLPFFSTSAKTGDVTCVFTNDPGPKKGNISVDKQDSLSRIGLPGATFALYKDNGDDAWNKASDQLVAGSQKATDSRGVASWSQLDHGTYFLEEITPPTGYTKSTQVSEYDGYARVADGVYKVVLSSDTLKDSPDRATVSGTVLNDRIPGTVSWQKVDDTGALIGGSVWSLTGPMGTNGASRTIENIADCTGACATGEFVDIDPTPGKITITGLPWNEVPGDQYTLTETKAPAGHKLATAASQTFVINAQNTVVNKGQVVNPRELGNAIIVKTDSTSKAPLAGAKFQVYRDADNSKTYTSGDTVITLPNNQNWQYTAAGTGEATWSNLPVGNYLAFEVVAPSGYVDDTSATRHLDRKWWTAFTVTPGQTTRVPVTNARLQGSLTWQKTDASSPTTFLAGSVWTLNGPNGSVDIADCTTSSCPTGANRDIDPAAGKFKVSGLPWGTYTLTEKTAPAGYVKSGEQKTVTIGAGNVQLDITFGAIANTRIPGELTWQKVSNQNSSTLLAGSEWRLTGPQGFNATITDCTVANGCGTSGYVDLDPSAGSFRIANLPWGSYTLTETKAPDGYRIA